MPRLRNATACCRALERAVQWLSRRLDSDAWTRPSHPLGVYHKLPYLLVMSGHAEAARRLLGWISENLCTGEGDCLAAPAGEEDRPASARVAEKAWVALAAHLSGRYDVAFPSVRFLASQQGPSLGGVYDLDEDGRREAGADIRSTATAGMAFLGCGSVPQARLAGHFLMRAVEQQADEKRFHVRLDNRGRLIRGPGKDGVGACVIVRTRGRTQVSYLGMPVVFLSALHLATGDADWLDAAMEYFAASERYDTDARIGVDSSSLGWGAAALYGITRRRIYYDAAERIAQAWIDRQKSDGSWTPPTRDDSEAGRLALTVEAGIGLLGSLREAQ